MRHYLLYSDASYDQQKSLGVYSFVTLDDKGRVYSQDTAAARFNNVFQAEMQGIIAGVRSLPTCCAVLCHSDIRAFADIYARGERSKHACVRELHGVVRDNEIEFSNHFERFRQFRSAWYELMHHRASLNMRVLVGRGGRTLFSDN